MTPRPGVPLGHPEFDAFLSASIGQDSTGNELRVVSMLAQLGLDPWNEAGRLSDLPRDAAVTALAAILARLPATDWSLGDLAALAERLADRLPNRHSPIVPPPRPGDAATPRPAPPAAKAAGPAGPMLWLCYGAIAVGFYFLFAQLQPERQLEPAPSSSSRE